MKYNFIVLLMIFFIGNTAFSQQASYNITYHENSGSPRGINSYADKAAYGLGVDSVSYSNADNLRWSEVLAIPFPFDFYGQPVTHFKMSTNGLITFDTTATIAQLPNDNTNLPNTNLPPKTIAAYWTAHDSIFPMNYQGNAVSAEVVSWISGQKQLWIRWKYYDKRGTSGVFISCVLDEFTQNFYIVDHGTLGGSNTNVNTGIQGFNATVGAQLDNISFIQFGQNNIQLNGNKVGPVDGNDNDFYEFEPVILLNDDAGISALTNPSASDAAGLNPVTLEIKNYGGNILDSVTIHWQINGVTQPSVNYYGNIYANDTDTFTVGNFNFPVGTSTITAWTSQPNNTIDSDISNDTLVASFCSGLTGLYTIGSNSADYLTLQAAINDLITCGISGAVNFEFQPGTYVGEWVLPQITGTNFTNQITFDGLDSNLVTLQKSISGNFSQPLLYLNGTRWITIKNLKFEDLYSSDYSLILDNNANHITFDNCSFYYNRIYADALIGAVGNFNGTIQSGNNVNHLSIKNCRLYSLGEKAIHILANHQNLSVGNNISNNYIFGNNKECLNLFMLDSLTISGNYIETQRFNGGIYGVRLEATHLNFEKNTVKATDFGVYIEGENFSTPVTYNSRVVNNMIFAENQSALYVSFDHGKGEVLHNTFKGKKRNMINSGYLDTLDVRNNIFLTDTEEAVMYLVGSSPSFTLISNHNIFHNNFNDLISHDGVGYLTLSDWQNFNNSDLNSYEVLPTFVSNDDLHLTGSLPLNVGDNTAGIIEDIDGEVRPQQGIVDIGADEFAINNTDIEVINTSAPNLPFYGLDSVKVKVTNLGSDTINNFQLNWEVNNTLQTPTIWSGSIALGDTIEIFVGTYNFIANDYEIVVWSSSPNNTTDSDITNDSTTLNTCTGLSGNYTIGGMSADYNTIAAATNALQCGIVNNVYFTINPGVYNEQVSLTNIAKLTGTERITFDGVDTSLVRITYDGSVDTATIKIHRLDNVVFKNLTIEATGTANNVGIGVEIGYDADSVELSNNRILINNSQRGGYFRGISPPFNNQDHCDYLKIINNDIIGKDKSVLNNVGIFLNGPNNGGNLQRLDHLSIKNNRINNFLQGISVSMVYEIEISNNELREVIIGVNLRDVQDIQFIGNQVYSESYSLKLSDATKFNRDVTVINNMLKSTLSNAFCIWLDDVQYLNLLHNTVFAAGTTIWSEGGFGQPKIRNNILISEIGNIISRGVTWNMGNYEIDNNIYYSFGLSPNASMFFFGNAYSDLAAWQQAEPTININSIEGLPSFLKPDDLHVFGNLSLDIGDSTFVNTDIDGDARPLYSGFDIGADEQVLLNTDVGLGTFWEWKNDCGDSITPVYLTIGNLGTATVSNINIVAEIENNGTTFTYNQLYTGSLTFGEMDTILLGTINTIQGGSFEASASISYINDQNITNDSITEIVIFDNTAVPIIIGATACSGDTAVLEILPFVTQGPVVKYKWYDAAIGGNLLDTGRVLSVTPTSTTDYYAEMEVYNAYEVGEKNMFTSGHYSNSASHGLFFNVYETMLLKEVTVYPQGSGTITVQIYAPFNILVHSKTVTIPPNVSSFRIPLDFEIVPGLDYRIAKQGTNVSLYRNEQTVQDSLHYPYVVPGIMEIYKDRNGIESLYSYFFDWEIALPYCERERTKTTVPVGVGVVIDSLVVTNIICNGNSDGQIIAYVEESPIPLNYTWNTAANTDTISNLAAGTYSLTVTNNTGCSDIATAIVQEPTAIIYSLSATPDTNYTLSGTANISVSGGTPPYMYQWNTTPTQTDSTAINLSWGTYEVTVSDANNCEINGSIFVDSLIINNTSKLDLVNLLKVYPNPARNEVNLELELAQDERVSIIIYDGLGRKVQTLIIEAALQNYQKSIDISTWGKGLYLIQININQQSFTRKLLVD